MSVAKLEQAPFRFLSNGIPSALFLQSLSDCCKGKSPVFAKEGLKALIPDDKDHRRERDGFFFENRVLAVFDLPFLHENVFVKGARRGPNLDALVSVEQSVRPLERTHGNQVDLDALTVACFGEFLDSPLEPALFLSAVRDSHFNLIIAAK